MIMNNTPNVICRGTDTNTHILTHKYLVHYSGISSHSFGHLYSITMNKQSGFNAEQIEKDNYPESKIV